MDLNKDNCTIVAKEITNRLESILSGNSETDLIGKKPEDVVLLGSIKAGQTIESMVEKNEFEVANDYKSAPSIGINFHTKTDTGKIILKLYGKFYYRICPTYKENLDYLLKKHGRNFRKEFSTADELIQFYDEKQKMDPNFSYPIEKIMYLYKSVSLEKCIPPLELDISNDINCRYTVELANKMIESKLSELSFSLADKSVNVKNSNKTLKDFLNEKEYNLLINKKVEKSKPDWHLKLYVVINRHNDYNNVIIHLTNTTELLQTTEDSFDTTIYNVRMEVEGENCFKPIELNEIKHNYITAKKIYGLGVNSAIDYNSSSSSHIISTNFPTYYQFRVRTVEDYNKYISFDKLIEDPIYNLRIILENMKQKLLAFKKQFKDESESKPIKLRSKNEEEYFDRFEKEIGSFDDEIYRFSYGINLIETKNDVKKAFELMNKIFKKTVNYSGWRLFQIVFIVSEITDICYSQYNGKVNYECNNFDYVDLIYFPTGGGKTETFLGCTFYAAFFDRIRGKKSGITAFIKYPLRLLTAQQLDRVLALVMNANIIKKDYSIGGEDFSAGFFTGAQNTPNSIDNDIHDFLSSHTQLEKNEKFRQIDRCPLCKSANVNIVFDEEHYLLKHVCDKCGDIPVSIVDNEIYRKPPTFLISTIDKMANFGLSFGFKTLFGKNYGKCPKHGYIFYKSGKCSCPKCNETIIKSEEVKDPVPTLFIQDELHLLNESLGTFDSHYERLIYYYCAKLLPEGQRKKIKYIGATATISDYKEHCYNLYLKQSRCFPTSVKDFNFYSYISYNDLNRIIIGAKLYSTSITDAIQKVLTYYRMIILDMLEKTLEFIDLFKQKGFTGEVNDLVEILNQYLISILYCNSKDDAGRVKSALENQGKIELNQNGYDDFNFGSITGDDDFKKIKDVMHEIESKDNKTQVPNMIISTSAISHGVDEDSFNNIFFYGMPNKTAEYVQAYSRAGRKYTGIVVDVMRIVRDRDMSYLKNFDSFHRYKDMLIEPVPIQRWAKNAVFNTLPGILSALLIHYYDCSTPSDVKDLIAKNIITDETIIEIISEIYGCNEVGPDGISYRRIITQEITSILNGFRTYNYDPSNDENNRISKVITMNNSINKRPMTNLRDVDVQLRLKRVE